MRPRARGFSLIELLVTLFVISLLTALVLPGVMQARESARLAQCANNLKQIGLAMSSYHDTNNSLPVGAYDCCWGTWMVGLLPYVDETPSFNLYNHDAKYGMKCFQPDKSRYSLEPSLQVTSKRFQVFTCPSDTPNAPVGNVTSHNYAINFGNTTYAQAPTYNGVKFGEAPFTRMVAKAGCKAATGGSFAFNSFRDGIGTTMLVAEVRQGPSTDLRGFTWFGEATSFQTYLPPNTSMPDSLGSMAYCKPAGDTSLPCQLQTKAYPMMSAARSYHNGAVQAVLADGAVRNVNNNIDLTTWRALSTTRGKEIVGDY